MLLERSKTDQEGEGAVLYLSPRTITCVQRWRALAGLTNGPLFRLSHGSQVRRPSTGRSTIAMWPAFTNAARAVGIEASQVAGHSLRIGATQDLLAAGFTGIEVQRQGRWKTERMAVRYGEKGAMARLLAGQQAAGDAPEGLRPPLTGRS